MFKVFVVSITVCSLFFSQLCFAGDSLNEMPQNPPPDAEWVDSKITTEITSISTKITELKRSASDIKKSIDDIAKNDSNIKLIESANSLRVMLSSDILFDFDKYDIRGNATKTLGNVAKILENYPNSEIVLEGHTDSKGDDDYNMELSIKRSDSVKEWFSKNSNATNSFESIGFGESKPIEKNVLENGKDNPKGREKNRRVEIVINKNS